MFQMNRITARQMLLASLLLLATGGTRAACYVTPGGLAFGTYRAAQPTALDATVNVTFRCDANAALFYSFNGGGSGNTSARRMTNGTDMLQYQLYTDTARTQVVTWGFDSGTPAGRSVPYYGRIAANQDVSPGAYRDTLTVTVLP